MDLIDNKTQIYIYAEICRLILMIYKLSSIQPHIARGYSVEDYPVSTGFVYPMANKRSALPKLVLMSEPYKANSIWLTQDTGRLNIY